MKLFHWIALVIAGMLSALLLLTSISLYSTPQTIRDVGNTTYIATINDTLAKQNKRFSADSLSISEVQYIQDSIALVKATTKDGVHINFVFEYYNATLFLTNYSTGRFVNTDFNNPEITQYINNAIGE